LPHSFETLRAQYPVFRYKAYRVTPAQGCLRLQFDFEIEGLAVFSPETVLYTDNLTLLNDPGGPVASDLVFHIGLVEAISYWKSCCCPQFVIECGSLSFAEILWWKQLWYRGLGEFFYRNGIQIGLTDFVSVSAAKKTPAPAPPHSFRAADLDIVPVGGGKDSCVSLHLLKTLGRDFLGMTVNDQPARTATFLATGYPAAKILRFKRRIDPVLLRLNAEGYLNGHTPFSALVAFLGLYAAYLVGAAHIVLSNEAGANEASVPGTDVNHQYSKSYQFEQDFRNYTAARFSLPICYFSLLRPFQELQIAKQFAALPQYHSVFRSCNVGAKENIWCCNCAKCLFVYLMFAPFLSKEELAEIFGADLLNKPQLQVDLAALLGYTPEKPFECVGTVAEARAAYAFVKTGATDELDAILCRFHPEHSIPPQFMPAVERMSRFVRGTAPLS
jgi:hypothetical protein